jgi:hypothetical protein
MMLQHDDPVLFQKIYEQTGTKATEIHSNHCLYRDTIFPQFDDLIKHSRENHPHHCYYCKTTFVLFEEVIKHSTENHGSLMLKVKYLELNPASGHYVEILYHSINNGGCGFLLLWFLFVRKKIWNKTGSSCCNIIHETGYGHFDMTHFFRPVLTYINN